LSATCSSSIDFFLNLRHVSDAFVLGRAPRPPGQTSGLSPSSHDAGGTDRPKTCIHGATGIIGAARSISHRAETTQSLAGYRFRQWRGLEACADRSRGGVKSDGSFDAKGSAGRAAVWRTLPPRRSGAAAPTRATRRRSHSARAIVSTRRPPAMPMATRESRTRSVVSRFLCRDAIARRRDAGRC
jgi:hypothetical protein